ncbi:MAG: hypothetical protein ACJ74Q_15215 [Pyrinomonadaceae bacterium]
MTQTAERNRPQNLADLFPGLAGLAPAQRNYAAASAALERALLSASRRISEEITPSLESRARGGDLSGDELARHIDEEMRIEAEERVDHWRAFKGAAEVILIDWAREELNARPPSADFDFDATAEAARRQPHAWQELLDLCMSIKGRPTRSLAIEAGEAARGFELGEDDLRAVAELEAEEATDAVITRWAADVAQLALEAHGSAPTPTKGRGRGPTTITLRCGAHTRSFVLSEATLHRLSREKGRAATDNNLIDWTVRQLRRELKKGKDAGQRP